ncbi:MAG TPA: hypothetical protein VKV02_01885, partial [Acidobacteriaceae bacterium]|nr:hypothetical protein [Acidobacteriaceae bacterium]
MSDYPVSPAEVSGTVPDVRSDVEATPEGDNEFAPDQPLPGAGEMPAPVQRPRGNEPHSDPEIRPAL